VRLLTVPALAILLAGCGKSGGDAAATGKGKFESNDGRYTVELSTSPSPIAVNEPFDVSVTVTPKSKTAADLEVLVDARMPAHFHGMNRVPKVTRGAGNAWKAEGLLFHMPGHWELYVDITRGGATERAQMDVNLK
jgi:hypothetical protein